MRLLLVAGRVPHLINDTHRPRAPSAFFAPTCSPTSKRRRPRVLWETPSSGLGGRRPSRRVATKGRLRSGPRASPRLVRSCPRLFLRRRSGRPYWLCGARLALAPRTGRLPENALLGSAASRCRYQVVKQGPSASSMGPAVLLAACRTPNPVRIVLHEKAGLVSYSR